jgi:predicted phosphohydrolase
MTVNFISDLHGLLDEQGHVSLGLFDPSKLQPADALAIAGDLGYASTWPSVLGFIQEKAAGKFKRVWFVKGNHDYWLQSSEQQKLRNEFFSLSRKAAREKAAAARKNLLEEDKIDELFMGVRVLGTTLWSKCWSPDAEEDKQYERISYGIADYACVPVMGRKDSTELFFKNAEWLKSRMAEAEKLGQKALIITHHGPRPELVSPQFQNSPYNPAFFVMDDSLAGLKPALWIHGHSHDKLDVKVDGVRYARNPIGYDWLIGKGNESIRDYEIPDDSSWYNNVLEV